MEYQTRFFNNDPANGILCAGYLDSVNTPQYFHNLSASYYQCSLVLNGSGSFSDSDHNIYPLHPGSVYQVLPDQPFTLKVDSDIAWKEFRIGISATAYQALNSLQLLSKSPVFTIELKTYLLQWIPVLSEELKNTPQKELSEVYFNIQKLILNIHKENIDHAENDISIVIESAKQLLGSSYTNDLPLSEVATKFNMSYEKFRRLFKERTGQSPIQFQLTIKFRYAQRFLTEGMSIKETALMVGYADPYIFSKQFKKYVGQSPRNYKMAK